MTQTTIAGIAGFVAAVGLTVKYAFDGDPNTVADWNVPIVAFFTMWGLLKARENTVSDKTAGAK